jgi:ligand-binding sensor domain-containing protein
MRTRQRSCRFHATATAVALATLVAAALLAGLVETAAAYTWPFVHYTENEGLPTSVVMGIAQDDSGCVWIATRSGIASYDGADWTLYDATRGLPTPQHRDITVDHMGGIWAVAQQTPLRVSRLVGDRWETLPDWRGAIDGIEPRELIAGRDGEGNVALAVLIQGKWVVVWARGQWWTVNMPAESGTLNQICWQGHELLIASQGGLYRVTDPGRADAPAPVRVTGLPPGEVYAPVIQPETGALHVAGDGWYGELTAGGFKRERFAESLHLLLPSEGIDAAIDALGGLYIGTPRSLYYLHPLLGLEHLTQENGLVSRSVTDLLIDREGVAWIASQRGID